jgi:hypothetical protein
MKDHVATAQFCPAVIGRLMLAIYLALCTAGLGGLARAQKLNITPFDVPAAGTGLFQGTFGVAINPEGAITGFYTDLNYVEHGFLRNPQGVITTFDAPGASTDGYGTFGIGLNADGVTIGYYTNSNFNYGGFVRRPDGKFETFRYPKACTTGDPEGCEGTGLEAINASGVIAGGYVDKNFVQHALLIKPDGMVTKYDAPGAGNTPGNPANISPLGDYLYQGTNLAGIPPGLNGWGAVTSGFLDENNVYHGYLRSPHGAIITFDAPGAGQGFTQGTFPVGLNDWGLITGYYLDSNNVFHGFLRSAFGRFTNLDAPGADTTDAYFGTQPSGVNDLGEVTGSYLDASGVWHGFILSQDRKFTTFDVPGADLTPGDFNGTFPSSINLNNTIVGTYIDVNNVYHGFVATPCHEDCSDNVRDVAARTTVSPITTRIPSNPRSVRIPNPRSIARHRNSGIQP